MNMNFAEGLIQRLLQPLPGSQAQNMMLARRVNGARFDFNHSGPPKRGGVSILIYPDKGSWYIPLTKRSDYRGVHSGQVSFPGGKMEAADEDLVATAIRETQEELGVPVKREQVVGTLTELYIIASHFKVLPVVAILDGQPEFQPDPREVSQVIKTDISHLLKPSTIKERDIEVRGFQITAPYFDIQKEVVWGATAMILNEFLELIREVSRR